MKRTVSSDCHGLSPTLRGVIPARAVRTMYSLAFLVTMTRWGTMHFDNHTGVRAAGALSDDLCMIVQEPDRNPRVTICRFRCLTIQLVYCSGPGHYCC